MMIHSNKMPGKGLWSTWSPRLRKRLRATRQALGHSNNIDGGVKRPPLGVLLPWCHQNHLRRCILPQRGALGYLGRLAVGEVPTTLITGAFGTGEKGMKTPNPAGIKNNGTDMSSEYATIPTFLRARQATGGGGAENRKKDNFLSTEWGPPGMQKRQLFEHPATSAESPGTHGMGAPRGYVRVPLLMTVAERFHKLKLLKQCYTNRAQLLHKSRTKVTRMQRECLSFWTSVRYSDRHNLMARQNPWVYINLHIRGSASSCPSEGKFRVKFPSNSLQSVFYSPSHCGFNIDNYKRMVLL